MQLTISGASCKNQQLILLGANGIGEALVRSLVAAGYTRASLFSWNPKFTVYFYSDNVFANTVPL